MDKLFKLIDKVADAIVKNRVFKSFKAAITIHPSYIWSSREIRYPSPIDRSFATPINIPVSEIGPYDEGESDPRERKRVFHVVLNPKMKQPENWKTWMLHDVGSTLNPNIKVPNEGYIPAINKYEDIKPYSDMSEEDFNLASTDTYPTHLPREWWFEESADIINEYISKGLPPLPGRFDKSAIPQSYEDEKW